MSAARRRFAVVTEIPAEQFEVVETLASALCAIAPAPVQRLTLRAEEAAAALGISRDVFDEKVAPQLRAVRFPSSAAAKRPRALRLYPIVDLQRWVDENASAPLEP